MVVGVRIDADASGLGAALQPIKDGIASGAITSRAQALNQAANAVKESVKFTFELIHQGAPKGVH